jgi:pyruvate formate lyase activating enzyme
MRIGGLQKLTLIDYPGKVAATVFTQGCNLRCGYCHNPELVLKKCYSPIIPENQVLNFLTSRRFLLQGVVITGGEPTLQKDLADFLMKIKDIGLVVKLDTNGTSPNLLEKLVERHLIDYIAMDIKTSFSKYHRITGAVCSIENIKRSIEFIRQSGIDHEFRTTAVRPLCASEDLKEIRNLIGPHEKYRVQQFQCSEKIIDPTLLKEIHYSTEEISFIRQELEVAHDI